MSKRKLLIVDNSEDFPIALSQYLKKDYQVMYCLDGKEALSVMSSFQPDILFTEIVLPGLDGISLLESVASQGFHPLVMTFTPFYNSYMISALTRLNVGYWMIKPCDLHAIGERIRDLTTLHDETDSDADDPQTRSSELLLCLGFVMKHQGFTHLQEAILMELQKPGRSVTKELYPDIAKKLGCSQATVEHSIRTAIQSAWEKRNDAVWQQFFPQDASGSIPRPTNATAIIRLAQVLRQNR